MRWRAVCSVFVLGVALVGAAAQTITRASGRSLTIQACLSGGNAVYVLTDSKGQSYRLVGDPAKLSAQAGHEVLVTDTS